MHPALRRIVGASGEVPLTIHGLVSRTSTPSLHVSPTFRALSGFAACLLLLPPTSGLRAQETEAPCSSPEHRQFDFWLGEWNVFENGEKTGENTIRRAMGGCVIHESYRSTDSDYEGQSFNVYDARRGVWHQSWVDDQGLLLRLEGAFEDGKMRLEGAILDSEGREVLQRITWSRLAGNPDRVRQLWEQSADGGESWEVVFDGTYVRVK